MVAPNRTHRCTHNIATAAVAVAAFVASAASAHATPSRQAAPSAAATASVKAHDSGRAVRITALDDAYSTTSALPDGGFRRVLSDEPVRVRQGGRWVAVDTRLVRRADGTLAPRAIVGDVMLSGGGTSTIATLHSGGVNLTLSSPDRLPQPTVAGSTAVYHDVVPGADLQVGVSATAAVTETVVIKTAAAAQNPRVRALLLRAQASHGRITLGSDGHTTLTDASGAVAFRSLAPAMWDSAARAQAQTGPSGPNDPHASSTPAGPGSSARSVAAVARRQTPQLTSVGMSTRLLDAPTTEFPAYLSSSWISTTKSLSGWTWAQEAHPTSSHWNGASIDHSPADPAVGYQGWSSNDQGRNRAYYQFDIGSLGSADINAATLNAVETYTGQGDCSSTRTIVETNTNHISSSTTWSSQPSAFSQSDSASVLGAYISNGCPNRKVGYDVTSAVSSDGDGVVTFRLAAKSETDRDAYSYFSHTATLTISYNHPPGAPTSETITPAPQNPSGGSCTGSYGWVGPASSFKLAAHVSDPDGAAQQVQARFQVWDKGGSGTATASTIIDYNDSRGFSQSISGTGGTVYATISTSLLSNGHLYGTDVHAYDGVVIGPASDYCYFWYDKSAPTVSSVTSTDFNDTGTGAKVEGQAGTFTVQAADYVPSGASYSGIDHFIYSTVSASDLAGDGGTHVAATKVSGATSKGSITFTPTVWGENYLYVSAVDKAGNQAGGTYTYKFYVPDNTNAAIHSGDVDGDSHPDLLAVNSSTKNLELYPTYKPAAAKLASSATNSPDGATWANTLTAHRSSLTQSSSANKVDDLWAYKGGQLYLYVNNMNDAGGLVGNGNMYFSAAHRTLTNRPACTDVTCNSSYASTWVNVTQMIAPGDVDGDGIPDLITVEAGKLWFFHGGTATGQLADPRLLNSTVDWTKWRIMAPGDDSGDGIPDIWAADNTTTGSGQLLMYRTVRDASSSLSLANPIVAAPANLGTDARPKLTSLGDTDGDGFPDLISITNTYQLWQNPGTKPSPTAVTFGAHHVVDDGTVRDWSTITSIS